jgi:hypothetical protein
MIDLENLENKAINLQNTIIHEYNVLEELWRYHPSNENFINPIKEYEKLKERIGELELKLDEIQNQIKYKNLN